VLSYNAWTRWAAARGPHEHMGTILINGCISFVCSGCAEHVLANEVVRNTLREQTEQCSGCTTFWGGAEGIKMAEPTIFFFT